MKIGLGLGISRLSSGGPSGPVSLYDTSDMTTEGTAANTDVIDANSFRAAHDGSEGRFLISGVPSGDYRITGTVAAYDGSVSGITGTRFRITDNFTSRFDTVATGAIDEVVTISSGLIRFRPVSNTFGFRFDDFVIVAA